MFYIGDMIISYGPRPTQVDPGMDPVRLVLDLDLDLDLIKNMYWFQLRLEYRVFGPTLDPTHL